MKITIGLCSAALGLLFGFYVGTLTAKPIPKVTFGFRVLLGLAQLTAEGKPTMIDGFRLSVSADDKFTIEQVR